MLMMMMMMMNSTTTCMLGLAILPIKLPLLNRVFSFVVEAIRTHMVDEDVGVFYFLFFFPFLRGRVFCCCPWRLSFTSQALIKRCSLQGSLKFHVKWEGWDAKEDLTWEPEDNLK